MKKTLILLFLIALFLKTGAQNISLMNGWKLAIGDSVQWSSPGYNDNTWQNVDITKSWEKQGYPNHDGFGWYRLHVVIPSSITKEAFFKDSVVFNLGYADDNDEVYLNGILIGEYDNSGVGTIKDGRFGLRSYTISRNNPAILWDKENVLSIRIYDVAGDGGVYGSNLNIGTDDVMAGVHFDAHNDYEYADKSLSRQIMLVAKNRYDYKGKLVIKVTDPETRDIIDEKTEKVEFTAGKPYTNKYQLPLIEKSLVIDYTFTDEKTGKKISLTESTPYILTPVASEKPKINGPDVYGIRPGHPLIYLIPATGQKPLSYKAKGLPSGLTLDASTGIITGSITQRAEYPVTFVVSNKLGSNTKKISFVVGDEIGLTPALGWNSWNAWGLSVNETKVRTSAKAMADKLSAYGWSYINIDDGWESEKRLNNGEIATNAKFPDMKGLADYVHGLGLHFGIYSSPGPRTCGGYLASWQHEDQDAKTYGDWGVDYLKYDWCTYSEITSGNPDLATAMKPYQIMRNSLDKVNRDILFSFCQYGWNEVWKWGAKVGGNSWRTTGDITDTWQSMSSIGFNQNEMAPYAQPGHFNDPDMLVVGRVGWGPSIHNSRLTFDEQYTHVSLWSLLASPLLIGCDMGNLDKFTLNLLTNAEVLAINQDALGKSARQYIKKEKYQIWVKELKDGGKAIGFFNVSDESQTVELAVSDPVLKDYKKFRDVWRQHDIKPSDEMLSFKLAPHGVRLIRVEK
ncbi:MAG: putative Ig domain-containing protein [Paludibacter sp.]|nr:putative Ig domain-containing protein [Paludibacter sp.]